MTARPLVHIGLAKTASSHLQRDVFPKLPGLCYLGKHPRNAEQIQRFKAISRVGAKKWNERAFQRRFDTLLEELVPGNDRLLWSEENFSRFSFFHPRVGARRLRQLLDPFDVLVTVRAPLDWLQSQYHFQLTNLMPGTLDGINHWIAANEGLGRGSEIGEVRFVQILDIYRRISGGDVHVIPYELLAQNPAEFYQRLGAVLDIPAAQMTSLTKRSSGKRRNSGASQRRVEFLQQARLLLDGEHAAFRDYLGLLESDHNARFAPEALSAFDQLAATGNTDLEQWKPHLLTLLRSEQDYLNHGPPAHSPISDHYQRKFGHIGWQQQQLLRDNYGVDLQADGLSYGARAPEREAIDEEALATEAVVAGIRSLQETSTSRYPLDSVGRILRTAGIKNVSPQTRLMGRLPARYARPLEAGLPPLAPGLAKLEVTEVIPARDWDLPRPRQLNAATLPESFSRGSEQTRAVRLFRGESLRLYSNNGAPQLVRQGGHVCEELSYLPSRFLWPCLDRMQNPTHLPGKTLYCGARGNALYPHWLLDVLPRLDIAQRGGHSLDSFDQIVFGTLHSSFHRACAQQLSQRGIGLYSLEETGPLLEMDEAVFVSDPRTRSVSSGTWLFDYLKREWGQLGSTIRTPHRKIYISRERTNKRTIINEEETWAALEQRGFERIYAEDLSVQAMAATCAEATHVVGAHGGGITNIVFAQPGTRVLEIYSEHLSRDYWSIAGQADMAYFVFQGRDETMVQPDTLALQQRPLRQRNVASINVPIEAFSRALDEFLAPG